MCTPPLLPFLKLDLHIAMELPSLCHLIATNPDQPQNWDLEDACWWSRQRIVTGAAAT